MRKCIRVFDVVLGALCAVIFAFITIGSYTMPDEIIRYETDSAKLTALYSYSGGTTARSVDYQTALSSEETLKLLKVVPVKTVKVTAKPSGTVCVSGEVFGIKLYTDGVIVVGTQSVDTGEGKINPAEEAGIEIGDIIISINNTKVYSSTEVTRILNDNNGDDYTIKLKRDGRYKTFTLAPVYSPREGCYKAGMWVRDSTAGIGTITFYNPQSGTFAALGHPINDVDTNELMPLLKGEAVNATVTKVQKASAGMTGSLWCDFSDSTIGALLDNAESGLYGTYDAVREGAGMYPVASKQAVKKGAAQMITTVDGTQPKAYDIEILRISYNKEGEQKDIIFKITDEELLNQTGGIVQGMSGSPIIQNGALVGAVTHVIVNNPEKGYAIFAQTMYEKSVSVGK